MKISKYTTDDNKVYYDLQGLTPQAYAAIVAAVKHIDKNGDDAGGVFSCNAGGLAMKFDAFERANVDAVTAEAKAKGAKQ